MKQMYLSRLPSPPCQMLFIFQISVGIFDKPVSATLVIDEDSAFYSSIVSCVTSVHKLSVSCQPFDESSFHT